MTWRRFFIGETVGAEASLVYPPVATARDSHATLGHPCSCGSGKKYKKCHGA